MFAVAGFAATASYSAQSSSGQSRQERFLASLGMTGGFSRCWKESPLFVEQGWLGDGWSGGLAAGYAYYPEDGDFGEGGSGDEDAVGIGV